MTEKPMSLDKKLRELEDAIEKEWNKPLLKPDDSANSRFVKEVRWLTHEVKELLAEAADSWPRLCAFYLEEGTGHKDEDKSCENCIYHPDNIHEINDGLTKDEWKSTPCPFPDTKKRVFGGGAGSVEA
ncbi:hypothetical protein MUP01_12045 [Candidatus Bathyarchaeota archaeon]|nr:hypothetical protein [Candidatus Bathyarchaeota archaeon]